MSGLYHGIMYNLAFVKRYCMTNNTVAVKIVN